MVSAHMAESTIKKVKDKLQEEAKNKVTEIQGIYYETYD